MKLKYRLASDKSIIEQEEGMQPIEVDDRLMNITEVVSRRTGLSYEKILLDFITEVVAKSLAYDTEKLAHLEALAHKHHCNILTEVNLNGKIISPKQHQMH